MWCSFTAFDEGIYNLLLSLNYHIHYEDLNCIHRKEAKDSKAPIRNWVKLSVSFYRTWISLINCQDPQIILIINWDSGFSKVAKMGVLASDQWRTSLFFSPAYSCHLFHLFFQGMNWQGQCQKLSRSYWILLYCKLTYYGVYHKKFLQRLPWLMVTLFFLFADIWAGTNSQVQFPIVSRKSLTVDVCS
jgi:hypothetical protein